MTKKTSVRAIARQAVNDDSKARKVALQIHTGSSLGAGKTVDSFVNFAHKMGIGADNPLTSATYAFNPITRERQKLEWIHRGSWLGGQVIDVVANDMTREGAECVNEMDPDDSEVMENEATSLGVWDKLNECVKWGRLYGGAIAVPLIDGQDPKTPLRLETIKPDQFKGILILDRWMLEPSLEELVDEYGPCLGLPKFYRVGPNAPAMRGAVIHYSRVLLRHTGVELPYQQSLTENLWGASVLERLYDRMIAFDSASTGMAQLVYKCWLRTLKIKDLRTVVASGNKAMDGLIKYAETMRRYQGIEGLSLIDGDDELEVQQIGSMAGLSDALLQLGQQLSGATGIPLVRLFGQSPAGLNSTGESDLRNYYDNIKQQQMKLMHGGVVTIYSLIAASKGIKLPDNFQMAFRSLWQLDDEQKANIAKSTGEAVKTALEGGIISQQVALKELRQSSRTTGIFTNITREDIDAADDTIVAPGAADDADKEHEAALVDKAHEHEAGMAEEERKHREKLAQHNAKTGMEVAKLKAKGGNDANGKKPVGGSKERRKLV